MSQIEWLKKTSTNTILAIVLLAVILPLSVLGILTITKTLSSSGTVTTINVNVFSDSQCTQILNTIDWGAVRPNSTVPYTIYVKNTGDLPLTLSMTTLSWNPEVASDYMMVEWNRENMVVLANQTTSALLILTVGNVSSFKEFSVNIVISGTG